MEGGEGCGVPFFGCVEWGWMEGARGKKGAGPNNQRPTQPHDSKKTHNANAARARSLLYIGLEHDKGDVGFKRAQVGGRHSDHPGALHCVVISVSELGKRLSPPPPGTRGPTSGVAGVKVTAKKIAAARAAAAAKLAGRVGGAGGKEEDGGAFDLGGGSKTSAR